MERVAARAALLFASWLVAAATAACTGEREERPPPEIADVRVERIREQGLATVRSRLTVTFAAPPEFADSRLPLASHFEIDLALATGGTRRLLVARAERSEMSRREILLEVDAVVSRGSVLKVARRAFSPGASGYLEVTIGEGLEPVEALLASAAVMPRDPDFFDPAEAREPDPAADDAAAMREVLRAHLVSRGSEAEDVADALGLYDAIPADTVPSPKIRAALAALTGTFAEGAIASLLTGDNCTGRPAARIDFQVPPGVERLLARVTYAPDGARVLSLHPDTRDDRFELLMPLLAHEAIHCDREDGRVEEIAATAFDTLLYLQLVAADPGLARERTRLARELRIGALALINSGGVYPETVGVLQSPGVANVLPGTNRSHGSFAEFVLQSYPAVSTTRSPTEQTAVLYAATLAAGNGMPLGDPFDLVYLDALLGRSFDARAMAAVIVAFGLEPAEP